jgi:protein involved in polysaccharide export with SLBB domain
MKISQFIAASCLILSLFVALPIDAQSINLTPQQQLMLNQLPPAQRQQALQALEQMNAQADSGTQLSSLSEEVDGVPPVVDNEAFESILNRQVLRAESDSRLVINLDLKVDLPREQSLELEDDPALQGIQGSNFYELDDAGILALPGLTSIPLMGLTAEQIEQRLGAEPALGVFDIAVTILESESTGVDALQPFGYDLFEADGSGFEPVMTGPVPPDYVLGPGDSVRVQLFGNVNGIYEMEVSRDGVLNLPELGPLNVAGLPFSEFREDVDRRVQEMLIGTQVSVSMGQLRTIRVFVLGDANRPGSYVVSSLATISSALYRSGGISRIGSLRDIQLKRNGRVAARLDLYELLLNGDTSGDVRLRPGDVIFVPPIGAQVSVSGAVNRPAIYEMVGNASLAQVIRIAGGLQPDAYPTGARVERIDAGQERIVVGVDASDETAANLPVRAGDVLTVPRVLPELEDTVSLAGHVQRPGPFQWRDGMRLTDLIGSLTDLRPGADSEYILIRREDASTRRISAVSANLTAALADKRSEENIALHARDTVHVFDLAFGRQRIIEPILEELQLQSNSSEPYREVSVSGQVKAPGSFPLETGMRVSDLIRAGGNLAEQAYTLHAELVRYEIIGGTTRTTEIVDVDLGAILRGDPIADLLLGEHDNLRISRVPDWESLLTVTLEGELTFPGEYRIRPGETLEQLLRRAGGLTDKAYAEGAIFLRESLQEREQEQIEVLARRLEADLTSLSLQDADTNRVDSEATGQSLLAQLRETEAVGRLVIDVESIIDGDTSADVELRDNDRLLVPQRSQEVTIIGETQQNTSHLYRAGLSRDDYINLSGGLTRRADKKLIYVVRASGAVVTTQRSRWFGRGNNVDIRPGDTIVVPLEVDRIRPLTLWTSVTQILYQAAIAVAAIDTFGN